jgi:hypothetical protein
MPKTDINKILKNGVNTKPRFVFYDSPMKKKELKKLKEEREERAKWLRQPIPDFYITI